jgi:hypothetical protein
MMIEVQVTLPSERWQVLLRRVDGDTFVEDVRAAILKAVEEAEREAAVVAEALRQSEERSERYKRYREYRHERLLQSPVVNGFRATVTAPSELEARRVVTLYHDQQDLSRPAYYVYLSEKQGYTRIEQVVKHRRGFSRREVSGWTGNAATSARFNRLVATATRLAELSTPVLPLEEWHHEDQS